MVNLRKRNLNQPCYRLASPVLRLGYDPFPEMWERPHTRGVCVAHNNTMNVGALGLRAAVWVLLCVIGGIEPVTKANGAGEPPTTAFRSSAPRKTRIAAAVCVDS